MLQFAQPIWLYAISGIAVPIAIHLWNVKQGKTLRVGSIALIEESSRQTSRNLKLTELLLLALRCLLIIFLSLLLAGPFWTTSGNKHGKGWLLIEQDNMQLAYQQYPNLIDSLIREGYDFHFLDHSFKKEKWPAALKEESRTAAIKHNYWTLLQMLDANLPAGAQAYIFAPNLLRNLEGRRPTLTHEVNWFPVRGNPIDSLQLIDAWTNDDSVHVIIARSGDSALTYNQTVLANDEASAEGIQVQKNNNAIGVSHREKHLIADTSSMIITVFTDKNRSDANYIIAALKAIQSFSKKNIKIELVSDARNLPAFQHWLFWLSEAPVPNTKAFGTLFRYIYGNEQSLHSWIETGNYDAGDIQLQKRILFDDGQNGNRVVWKDGYGTPLLVERKNGDVNAYEFYSRFNPSWNNLGWSNTFPALLMDLLLEKDIINTKNKTVDNREVDPSLLQFRAVKNEGNKSSVMTESADLSKLAWLIISVLFLLERWFSLRTKKVVVG
ncbi:BatA domain-containing protein [Danxiaibacter flavus]|uniref:BatA domain-containing protein n=1 Tax=Danxiaibacter flavus TaxID=3049108 RepID=A0ABV3ZNT4_9BACT|nr:BatA domain-containing protein [Chitinophagaceae bacterium DXS]